MKDGIELKGVNEVEFSKRSLETLKEDLRRRLPKAKPKTGTAALSTGSLSLDRATGTGGLPRGQLTVVGGGTTAAGLAVSLAMVAAAQKRGEIVAVVDGTKTLWSRLTEHSIVDQKRLAFAHTKTPVDAIRVARILARSDKVDLVLIGPLAGVAAGATPQAWLRHNATAAQELRNEITALTKELTKSRTAIVVLTPGRTATSPISAMARARELLGRQAGLVVQAKRGGNQRTTGDLLQTGGLLQMQVRGGATQTRAAIEIEPGGGVSRVGDIFETSLSEGLVERRGSVYRTHMGSLLGRGRDNAIESLRRNPGLKKVLADLAQQSAQRIAPWPTGSRGAAEEQRESRDFVGTGSVGPELGPIEEPTQSTQPVPDSLVDAPFGIEDSTQGAAHSSPTSSPQDPLTEISEPESTAASEPDEASETNGPRYLATWFEGDLEPILPLRVGWGYDFCYQVLTREIEVAVGRVARFAEPDFGHHTELVLLVSLFSADFEIQTRRQRLVLKRVGESEMQSTRVWPLHPGLCSLRLVVSLETELEILQSLVIEVPVEAIIEARARD